MTVKKYNFIFRIRPIVLCGVFSFLFFCNVGFAQNPKIKCYFNHPVNTTISTGTNAVYLNNTFPDTIAAYINRAKYSIDIALYNDSNDTIVAKLAAAVNNATSKGVIVRWIYDMSSTNSGLSLLNLNSNIDTFASPQTAGYIMHNKFLVIDASSSNINDPLIITGSYNWSKAQTSSDYNNLMIVQDTGVTHAYYNEFNKMWGGTGPKANRTLAKFSTKKSHSAQNIFNVNGTKIEVYFSPKDSAGFHLKSAIQTSNEDIFFGIYSFTDTTIASSIRSKINAGINVRGIMYDTSSYNHAPYAILNPVMGSNLLDYSNGGLYHNKIMLIDALSPASDPQVFTGSFNWSAGAQNSNDENAIIIHDVSIANQYYQSLCQNFSSNGGFPCIADPCPNTPSLFASNITGTTYQWQVNPGSGLFTNVSGTNYTGGTTNNLTISNDPSSWYGYQYRCLVNGTTYSNVFTLKFVSYWTGAVNNAWENASNWNCGTVPDINTDVIVGSGATNFPVVNSNAFCRSLHIFPGANCTVSGGSKLTVAH
jgi:phosphatidylserine/phosphatidylglycerophosphate/cardiolipin synthase-like enzyme